jgi:hypothetical protein
MYARHRISLSFSLILLAFLLPLVPPPSSLSLSTHSLSLSLSLSKMSEQKPTVEQKATAVSPPPSHSQDLLPFSVGPLASSFTLGGVSG